MGITYDKKALKKSQRYVKMGKKKYAIRMALFSSLFATSFIAILFYFMSGQTFSLKFFLRIGSFIIFYLIFKYSTGLKSWNSMNSLFYESIEYFKKNNPEFIADILDQNSDNDK